MNSLQVLIFGLLFLTTCQAVEMEDSDTDTFEDVESDPFYNPRGGDEDIVVTNTDTDSDFVPEGPPPSPANERARFTRNSGVRTPIVQATKSAAIKSPARQLREEVEQERSAQQQYPVKSAAQQYPVKTAQIRSGTKTAQIQQFPVKTARIQQFPVKTARIQVQYPTKTARLRGGTKSAPIQQQEQQQEQSAPIQQFPVKSAAQQYPVKTARLQGTKSAPIQQQEQEQSAQIQVQYPVKTARVIQVKSAPVRQYPIKSAAQQYPVKTARIQQYPVKSGAIRYPTKGALKSPAAAIKSAQLQAQEREYEEIQVPQQQEEQQQQQQQSSGIRSPFESSARYLGIGRRNPDEAVNVPYYSPSARLRMPARHQFMLPPRV